MPFADAPLPSTGQKQARPLLIDGLAEAQQPMSVRALTVAGALATVVFAITRLSAARSGVPLWITGALIIGVDLIAMVLVALRVTRVRKQRLAWAMVTAGLVCFTAASTYSWIRTGGVGALPFPSPGDVGWLLFYPFASGALLLLIRANVSRPRRRVLLDGAIAGLGAAAVLSAVAIGRALVAPDGGTLLSKIAQFGYPVGDAMLLGLALCLLTIGGRTGHLPLWMLIASVVAFTVGDTFYIGLTSRGNYHPGDPIDIVYMIALLLLGVAAWPSKVRTGNVKDRVAPLGLPITFALCTVGLLVVASQTPVPLVSIVLAGATLVAVVARTLVSFRQIQTMAMHDALTDLPNRALIMDRIDQLLVRNRRNATHGAVLCLDLDEFKNVNDTLGHAAGDQLLVAVAARLAMTLRGVDTVGRMGGDEFVVLVDGASLEVAPELVAERLLDVMRQPFELDLAAHPILVTTSIGIAAGERRTAGDLLHDADIALYRAKAAGKNCYELFHPKMGNEVQYRYELEFDLHSALGDEQFHLLYQPIYNVADLSLLGVEALIRWQHPTRGLVQPNDFIPLLEANSHIIEVGRWVLLEACRQLKAWPAQPNGLAMLTMSVNVSGRQLDHDGIIDDVAQALTMSGIDPGQLTLEITETALMKDISKAARRLQELKALGVQISIDDFGTGYCSLAYLQQFPIDCLKIDRAFVEAIATSPESAALIRTLVRLGEDLGLTTLGEGVQTVSQLQYLREHSVTHVQGFLLARPLRAEAVEKKILHQQENQPEGRTV